MYLTLHNDDGSRNRYQIDRETFADDALKNRIGYIHSSSKEQTALEIFKAYYSDAKAILLDSSNRILLEKLKTLNVGEFSNPHQGRNPFEDEDFLMMFFTSGSTGMPVGALKTRENLEAEVKSLTTLLEPYRINKIVVTVPFIHIYGMLLGLLYPLINGIDVVLKEHFLPQDLLNEIDEYTLVVTTPLYIKALTKLEQSKSLNRSLFVSSTAPLDEAITGLFIDRYRTHLIQLFGSTETGGIAYKIDLDTLWRPLHKVKTSVNDKNELLVSSPFVSRILYEEGFQYLNGVFETFDYVEMEEGGFRVLGRSSKILKIAGKRYSTIQIETVLEEMAEISKAVVFVVSDSKSIRGESLDITLESNRKFTAREIKKIIQDSFSNLKFSINLTLVDKITTTELGKKIIP
jgi:acyl-coenzyme A synthetase/AMP-(fatty) acid ligase